MQETVASQERRNQEIVMSTKITQLTRLKKMFVEKVAPELRKKFGYGNAHEIPQITTITVNIGTGKADKDAKLGEFEKYS